MATINTAITGGFKPESAVITVQPAWKDTLEHTGMFSVQLQQPGQAMSPPPGAAAGTPAELPPVPPGFEPDATVRALHTVLDLVRATQSSGGGQSAAYNDLHPHVASGPTGGQFAPKGSGIGEMPSPPPHSGGSRPAAATSSPAGTPQPPTEPRTMKPGDSGEDVRYAQYGLSLLGFNVSQSGTYDDATVAAVKQMQERLGVKKPNGHLTSAQLRQIQTAVRLSPCIGRSDKTLAEEMFDDIIRSFDLEDGEDLEVDDDDAEDLEPYDSAPDPEPDDESEPDEDTEALIAALSEVNEGVSRSFNEALHPRNPKGSVGGGRFRSITDRIVAALSDWKHGNGPDDPLKDFNRDQLLKAAKAHGHTFRRGASIEEIKAQILDDVRNGAKAEKAATPKLPGAPADHRRFTIQLGGEPAGPVAGNPRRLTLKHADAATIYDRLTTDTNANGRRRRDAIGLRPGEDVTVTGPKEDTLVLSKHAVEVLSNLPPGREGSIEDTPDGPAIFVFGDHEPLRDSHRAGKPTATDVGIFAAPSTGRLSLYRESDTGKKQGRAIKSFDDMAALEAWARDNGHTELADYARSEQQRTSGSKPPSGKSLAGDSALKAAAVNPSGDQLAAVTRMGGDGAYVVNDDLRANGGNLDALTPKNQATVEAMDALMADSKLTQDIVVHRKLAMTRNPFSTSTTGEVDPLNRDLTGFSWVEPGYSSTDIHGENLQHREISLRITVPAGTPAISHKELDSGEVLLPRGSTFKVTADHGGLPRKLDVELADYAKAEQARTGVPPPSPPRLDAPRGKLMTPDDVFYDSPLGIDPGTPVAVARKDGTDYRLVLSEKGGYELQEHGASGWIPAGERFTKPERLPDMNWHRPTQARTGGVAKVAKAAPVRPDIGADPLAGLEGLTTVQKRAALRKRGLSKAEIDALAPLKAPAAPKGPRPSGLPAHPVAADFTDLSERIAGKPEAQIREVLQDLNATELAKLANKFQGTGMLIPGYLASSARRRGLKIPDGLTLEQKREWLLRELGPNAKNSNQFHWRSTGPDEDDDAIQRAEVDDTDPDLAEIEAWAEEDPADFDDDAEEAQRALGHDVTLGHDELHHYWTRGEGLAKWAESPRPWTTLVAHLTKYVGPLKAKIYASRWFIEVFGFAAGSDKNRVLHGQPPRGHRIGPG